MGKNKPSGKKYLRLFDANANRCREGLRVIEDTARFVIGSEPLYKKREHFATMPTNLRENITLSLSAIEMLFATPEAESRKAKEII